MKLTQIPLVNGFYKDEARDWSVQDCVNYLPTTAESAGTRTQTMLRTAPGLRPFANLNGTGAVRGIYNCEGRMFAVIGETLVQVNANRSLTPIGTIPGYGRVEFAHNQATATGANQLAIGNGQAGYVYNTNTKVLERITDEGFIGGISPVFIDGYILWVSTNRLYAQNSSVADALEYNTLDWFQSEFSPDKLVSLAVSSSELILMSETSLEFFQNTGATEQPFRSKQISLTIGLAGRYCKAFSDNTVFFLANDGTFRRIESYNAVRISTGPVEQAIRGLDWSQAYSYVWEEGRYKVVYWTFPDGLTFGWDIANQQWHRRESYGLRRWRVSCTSNVRWNGLNLAGDFQNGNLWVIDPDYFMEGDQLYNCEITGPYIHGDGNLLKMPRMDIIMQTGAQDTQPLSFPVSLTLSGNPPDVLVGLTYPAFSFTATGGNGIYTFSVSRGSLPPGLMMNSAGTISGASLVGGDYQFSIRVFDSAGAWAEAQFSISVIAKVLGLATPLTLFSGDYDSLAAYATITNAIPAEDGAFSISPSSVFAAVGTLSAPYLEMYKLEPNTATYQPFFGFDVVPAAAVRACAFSPNGRMFAARFVVSGQQRVYIYLFNGTSFVSAGFIAVQSAGARMEWSPDSSLLAVSTTTGSPDFGFRVLRVNPETGVILGSFSPSAGQSPQAPEGFDWSPDGKYIVEWSNTGTNAWEIVGSTVVFKSTNGTYRSGRGAHFSDDGNYIYAVAGSGASPLTVFPFANGVIGAGTVPAAQPPFSVADSSFSSGHLALGKQGSVGTTPSVLLFNCSALSVVQSLNQPTGVGIAAAPAIRWTI